MNLEDGDVFVAEEMDESAAVNTIEENNDENGQESAEASDANESEPEPADTESNNSASNNTSEENENQEEAEASSNEAPPVEEEEEPEPRTYDEYTRGDEVGMLLVPEIDMKYPIYWGTDEETLDQGVGYHEGDYTTPPDGLRHTVLSGHRDTVFSELGDLEEGDMLYVQFEGTQYEYEMKKTWITDAEDRTVIVRKDEPVLTLTTCYPFNYIGFAPDRYIIEAHLVNRTEME
ncbi:class D sortase [Alkalicoccus urumqiensis]|uniref:Class D sortase n=2 Tax=Alkalicoccus urumqiensis TaxID=1548213 RepID=A0A2P6MII0_ALKUR|nr:class D sortase [Alkalicoccus urumqiensis]